MTKRCLANIRKITLGCAVLVLLQRPQTVTAEPGATALSAFNVYSRAVEARLTEQHRSAAGFLAAPAPGWQGLAPRLRGGEIVVEHLTPADGSPGGALFHHWRGTAFAPGAKAGDFEKLVRGLDAYPQHYAPQVVRAAVLSRSGDHIQTSMRIRQHHVITVVMDTAYDVTFGHLDPQHGFSTSRSTRVDEIEAAGTKSERVLPDKEEHGFLWQLNTYWSFEERDGGLYLQVESVSLSRSVPRGLGWAVRPYVESIPRESLDFTLRSTCNALRTGTLTASLKEKK